MTEEFLKKGFIGSGELIVPRLSEALSCRDRFRVASPACKIDRVGIDF
jgi:hypothetical protein